MAPPTQVIISCYACGPEPDAKSIDDLADLLYGMGITVVRKGNLARICEDQTTPEGKTRFCCMESEGDGPNELICNLFHVQVDNHHCCKLLKESRTHMDLRMEKEAEVQAATQADQTKPKAISLDRFFRRAE